MLTDVRRFRWVAEKMTGVNMSHRIWPRQGLQNLIGLAPRRDALRGPPLSAFAILVPD
jgi:hypothetical protein